MNILNLPSWEVTGHTETSTDYRIEATYMVAPANCLHCNGLFDKLYRHGVREQPTPKPRRSPAGGGTFQGSPAEGPIPTLGTDLDALLKELQQESGRPSGSNSRRR